MAPMSGILTVKFLSNYAGIHRVCWRIGGTGVYDCTTTVTCSGYGAACHVDIPITIDQETCDPIVYDGYVQATCEAIGSMNGRIPFTVTFTPEPICASYSILCNAVGVSDITITVTGNGYVPGATVAGVITGGGGTLAAAEMVIGDGGIVSMDITNGGTLYGDGTYTDIIPTNISGTGIDARCTVEVNGGIITAIYLHTTVDSPGTGYAVNDTFSFTDAQLGNTGLGSGLIITVTAINTGRTQYVTVTNAGSGYSSQAIVTFPPPVSGTQATADLIMENCDGFTIIDCNGDESSEFIGLEVTQQANLCTSVIPVMPTGYVLSTEGCCYDCVEVEFTITGDSNVELTYTDCYTKEMVTITLRSEVFTQCMVNNSWYYQTDEGIVSIVVGSICDGAPA